MSSSKKYYCGKINNMGFICGESDASKFEEGRYNACKQCRLNYMKSYNKSKKENEKDEKVNKLDPDKNIRFVVEDTIKRIAFIEGFTIKDRIESLDKNITSVFGRTEENMKKYLNFENIVVEKIQELKKENDILKEEINELKKLILSGKL
jgi:hypothetical protein